MRQTLTPNGHGEHSQHQDYYGVPHRVADQKYLPMLGQKTFFAEDIEYLPCFGRLRDGVDVVCSRLQILPQLLLPLVH